MNDTKKKSSTHQEIKSNATYISQFLKNEGLRMTSQRESVITALEKSSKSISIKDLYQRLVKKNKKIDEASVYRIIETLKGYNLVHTFSDGKVSLCSHLQCNQNFHLSLECTVCHQITEPHLSAADEVNIAKSVGLKISSVKNIQVEHICHQCDA